MATHDEFEMSDEQVEVERRPKAGAVLSVRLSQEEMEQLQAVAQQRKMTVSQLAREALVEFAQAGFTGGALTAFVSKLSNVTGAAGGPLTLIQDVRVQMSTSGWEPSQVNTEIKDKILA